MEKLNCKLEMEKESHSIQSQLTVKQFCNLTMNRQLANSSRQSVILSACLPSGMEVEGCNQSVVPYVPIVVKKKKACS